MHSFIDFREFLENEKMEVTGVEQIERGYECFAECLSPVGASIQQVTT